MQVPGPGRRWHLSALPTTLAKLDSISATTLARLLLRSQQRCKEVSTASQSGKSLGEASPLLIHTQPAIKGRFFARWFGKGKGYCPRRGGSGVEKGGDACVALGGVSFASGVRFGFVGRRKRPHSTQHHSRPYAGGEPTRSLCIGLLSCLFAQSLQL